MRTTASAWLCVLAGLALAGSTRAAQFKIGAHTFTVPDGFEIELVAGPPIVNRPITADFDEQGHLYVTDSSGSNEKTVVQLEQKPHRVLRLDPATNGRFEKSTVFADKMMFPEGSLWYDGSLYVGAPPSIWKLTDTDGDGVADERVEWYQAKTLTGCANDIHGPYLGLDGWIYWAKGAFAKQTNGTYLNKPFVTSAAHIFRAKPNATAVEAVMTGGMDNPVDVTFLPNGERFFTTTFLQHPGGGKRDGIIHAIYGGVYGKDHNVIEGHKRTGDLMPVLDHLGPAAPCGLTTYESAIFGPEYRNNLFACQFNLHKVSRHQLVPNGATYTSKTSDFVVSDNTDFHPTDVIEDADGSLLVVDTGGWYKLCCPTSQLWKPDILGGIYRIRKKGAAPVDDPRGLKLQWSTMQAREMARLLADPRPAVAKRAMQLLAKRGPSAIPPLKQQIGEFRTPVPVRNAVWTLTRMDAPAARDAVRELLNDADETVCHAAISSVSLWRDKDAVQKLTTLLSARSDALQRTAAEALGRIGDSAAIGALLDASGTLGSRPDNDSRRVLQHSLAYALIEIGNSEATRAALKQTNSWARKNAMIALDQMDSGALQADEITPLLTSADPVLKETALWIVSHHFDWADRLVDYFRTQIQRANLTSTEQGDLARLIGQFARNGSVQALLTSVVRESNFDEGARSIALRGMAQSGLKEMPAAWLQPLAGVIAANNSSTAKLAVAAVRSFASIAGDSSALVEALNRVSGDGAKAIELRLDAMTALPGGFKQIEPETFGLLLSSVTPSQPVPIRTAAASALSRARLSGEQLDSLIDALKATGPLELTRLLGVFEGKSNEATGLHLVAALKDAKSFSSLRPETIKQRLAAFPESVRTKGAELAQSLNADAATQQAHLAEMQTTLKDGDIRRGQAIFNSAKAACSSCHAIGYLGGNVGPDLTRIGQIRNERDLLESIVYPSASFVRSYEPIVVTTRAGDEYSGVIRKDAQDELVLATGPGTEVRVQRTDITEIRPGSVSVMPGGLESQMTRQELADLLAFLKANKG